MEDLLNKSDFGKDFMGIRNKLIIEMFYETGIRRAELISLNDMDVDLDLKNIKVIGKRNKQRIIPFGSELYEEINEYLDVRNETLGDDCESFFVNKKGKRISANDVYTIVRENCQRS